MFSEKNKKDVSAAKPWDVEFQKWHILYSYVPKFFHICQVYEKKKTYFQVVKFKKVIAFTCNMQKKKKKKKKKF